MNQTERLAAVGRPPTDAEWEAIDGRRSSPPFLFLVTSTGILCTPGCPARIPGRDRIRVVRSADEGLAVGARACLRCRPDLMFGFAPPDRADRRHAAARTGRSAFERGPKEIVARAIDRLNAAFAEDDEPPTDRELAVELSMPERRLREIFRSVLGVTPRAWVSARRTELLRAKLSAGQEVTTALYDAGFGSSSAAYEAVNGGLGMTPGRYRAGAAGESIRWTIAPIPEGIALVGATDRGLCSVLMGSDERRLADELHAEFPLASIARDDAALADLAGLVSDLALGRRRPDADALPLDVHATAFRRRVWEALRRIPAGQTRSYGEIAMEVGVPGAARAVGTACATNPVPIVVPCHRVVAANGRLGGYSGGLARKRQLLAAEGARVEGVGAAALAENDDEARVGVAAR